MLNEAYVQTEIAYRQGRMLAEAEDHRLRRQARANRLARKREQREQREHTVITGSQLPATAIPRPRRNEQDSSRDQAA